MVYLIVTKAIRYFAIGLTVALLSGGIAAAGENGAARPQNSASDQSRKTQFRVRPSEVSIPANAKLGQYRRIIQPFENWILICDENLMTQKRICNITQSIVDAKGSEVFSWSLAANDDGKPFMILRAPSVPHKKLDFRLDFVGSKTPILIQSAGCDEKICIGYLPVGPRMREYIRNGSSPQISYSDASRKDAPIKKMMFRAFLAGLASALEAIEN